jgi:phage terminase large subunit-like protein
MNKPNVASVKGKKRTRNDLLIQPFVNFVEKSSLLDVGTTVVNVASTWVADGNEIVYDITVGNAHEFFANGILSHNCDEPGAWRYRDSWDQLMLGLRLGVNPQVVCTSTPRNTELIRELMADPNVFVTNGTTYDNKANLSDKFYTHIIRKYEGTRLGRQELQAEMLTDNPGALWQRTTIDRDRITPASVPKDLQRIVVGVDPAVTSGEESDETGIVCAGKDRQPTPHYYIFDDATLAMATPDQWSTRIIQTYKTWHADRVIGEVNNGGDMIESILRHKDINVAYTAVRATRGKLVRAEPIAALYEQGRVHHVGFFPQLEDQLCDYTADTRVRTNQSIKSPDRMDALVWAMTSLCEEETSPVPIANKRSAWL